MAGLAGCGNNLIGERKLVKILAEMHFADALLAEQSGAATSQRRDSTAIYAPIFAKYNVSPSQLYPSMMPYINNKEKMAILYDKVIRTLEKNEARYAQQLPAPQKEQTAQ